MCPQTNRARHRVEDVPQAYNDKVVAFFRQPNIEDLLKSKHPTYSSSAKLKRKVEAIRLEGSTAVDRFSNDVELIILLRYVISWRHITSSGHTGSSC